MRQLGPEVGRWQSWLEAEPQNADSQDVVDLHRAQVPPEHPLNCPRAAQPLPATGVVGDSESGERERHAWGQFSGGEDDEMGARLATRASGLTPRGAICGGARAPRVGSPGERARRAGAAGRQEAAPPSDWRRQSRTRPGCPCQGRRAGRAPAFGGTERILALAYGVPASLFRPARAEPPVGRAWSGGAPRVGDGGVFATEFLGGDPHRRRGGGKAPPWLAKRH